VPGRTLEAKQKLIKQIGASWTWFADNAAALDGIQGTGL
jgi:hypothetical protein